MKKIFRLSFLVLILSTSCLKKDPILRHEFGVVVAKQYVPEVNKTQHGWTRTSKGELRPTTHYIHEDSQYDVVFKCEHGIVFTINKMAVFGKVKEYDTVVIDYYNLVNGDGEVKDFDFVDANKKSFNPNTW